MSQTFLEKCTQNKRWQLLGLLVGCRHRVISHQTHSGSPGKENVDHPRRGEFQSPQGMFFI